MLLTYAAMAAALLQYLLHIGIASPVHIPTNTLPVICYTQGY